MAEYLTNTADLTAVADAIRAKGGTAAQLVYPAGFVSAIQAIETGITPQLIVTTSAGAACTEWARALRATSRRAESRA